MSDRISVSDFVSETTEDYNSPTTSSFSTRLQSCRSTVSLLEEVGSLCPVCVCVCVTSQTKRCDELP